MLFSIDDKYVEIGAFVLLVLTLGASIFVWGRGIRRGRKSDLIAGPGIFVFLCCVLLALIGYPDALSLIGYLTMVFGFATLLLGRLARPGSPFPRRDVTAIGAGVVILGLCLLMIP